MRNKLLNHKSYNLDISSSQEKVSYQLHNHLYDDHLDNKSERLSASRTVKMDRRSNFPYLPDSVRKFLDG